MTAVLAEGLATLVAFVGLLAGVDALVHLEIGVRAEGLAARVRPLVEAVEGLGAVASVEWLVSAVDLLVHGERGVAGEGPVTAAPVGRLVPVDAEVAGEVRAG